MSNGGTDTGDHSPDETPGGMPRSRGFDGVFFVMALVLAIVFLIILFFLKG